MAKADSPSPLTVEAAADVAQASSLCTQCGLCCMGAIHVRAVLDEDEVQAASAIGLPVLDGADRLTFSLPCPKLDGTSCSIFGNRPRVCSRYQCRLLDEHQAGAVTLDTAMAKVAVAKELVRSVHSFTPAGMSLSEARMLANFKTRPKIAIPHRALQELRLRLTALELYLDRNFRGPKDGQLLEMKPVEGE